MSESNSSTLSKPEPPKTKKLPPIKVILHNDDENSFSDVVDQVMKIVVVDENNDTMNEQLAKRKVKEAEDNGMSLLTITHKERAELIVARFSSCLPPITATLEA